MAAETLPNTTGKICRERRGPLLPLMRRQWTEAARFLSFDVKLYVVVTENVSENQLGLEFFEVNPLWHLIISFRFVEVPALLARPTRGARRHRNGWRIRGRQGCR